MTSFPTGPDGRGVHSYLRGRDHLVWPPHPAGSVGDLSEGRAGLDAL